MLPVFTVTLLLSRVVVPSPVAEADVALVPDAAIVVPLGYIPVNPRVEALTCPPAATIPTTLPALTEILLDSMVAVERRLVAEAAEAVVPDAASVVPLVYRLLNPRPAASTCPPAATIPTTFPALTEILLDSMVEVTPVVEAAEAVVPDAFRLVPLGIKLVDPRASACTCPPDETIPTTLPALTETLLDSITVDAPVAEAAEAADPDAFRYVALGRALLNPRV
jgi:hypothetical protein